MLELLSPAGSPEAVIAAVQNGAGAVYLGYGDFNARRNAKNFTREQVSEAVTYCHQRGVRVFLTLNTLLTDRELPKAALVAAEISDMGVDAVIVQDLGVARMLRQTVPDLPIHGSTQMTVHSLDGVKQCADLGMERVVVSRELSHRQLEHLCQLSPIEIETFVHGALCMSYSGQCFFSSVIGGRSGNRGLCAQPCRLQYGWGKKADSHPLSLKDMSLAEHLQEIQQLGISCLKIEGRMKRPEYVAIVTNIYATALRENRDPSQKELQQLEAAFSRQGFTDDYFLGRTGPQMFGTRQEEKPPQELYALARQSYEGGDKKKTPITFFTKIVADAPVQLAVQDSDGHTITVEGGIPELAKNVPITKEKVENQLSRTGGTPYACTKVVAMVDDGLSLPLSTLNALRREALDLLSKEREVIPQRRTLPFNQGVRYDEPKHPPHLTLSLNHINQLSPQLLALNPHRIYLPVDELAKQESVFATCRSAGVPIVAILPRICSDVESRVLGTTLLRLKKLGLTEVLAGTLGVAYQAKAFGFLVRGDYGLGVFNSQALKELRRLGLISATPSFELKLAQIRDLNKAVPLELIAYGRLPLMVTENSITKNRTGNINPNDRQELVDRKGEHFPVIEVTGNRSEILNAKTLFLADKARDYQRLGLESIRLMFTTEDAVHCVDVTKRYLGEGKYQPRDYTRGLYYRDVE